MICIDEAKLRELIGDLRTMAGDIEESPDGVNIAEEWAQTLEGMLNSGMGTNLSAESVEEHVCSRDHFVKVTGNEESLVWAKCQETGITMGWWCDASPTGLCALRPDGGCFWCGKQMNRQLAAT